MQYTDLALYDYYLPKSLIAQKPAIPRDSCRLLVYYRHNQQIINDYFYNLDKYLPKKSLLVLNNTKVISARIMGQRATGGKIEILMTRVDSQSVEAMVSRSLVIGETVILNGGLKLQVRKQKQRFFLFKHNLSLESLLVYLQKYGQMPIPPYIKHPDSLVKLKTQYQTVFAKESGSIAAPTASLHFTKRMLNKLEKQNLKPVYVTLHVGLGTFLPLSEQNFRKNQLHQEWYQVKPQVWKQVMTHFRNKQPIIAVGTTVARTLESITKTLELVDETRLFIKRPYRFKLVTGLLTNFHLPKSSLLLLIDAFIKSREQTLFLYNYAVSQKYRFYSFGDAMLIL